MTCYGGIFGDVRTSGPWAHCWKEPVRCGLIHRDEVGIRPLLRGPALHGCLLVVFSMLNGLGF